MNNLRSYISAPSKLSSSPCIHQQPHLMRSLIVSSNKNFREKYSILRYASHFCQRQPESFSWNSTSSHHLTPLWCPMVFFLSSAYLLEACPCPLLEACPLVPSWGSQMCLSLLPFSLIFISYLWLISSIEHKFNYPLNTDDLQISFLAHNLSFKILAEYHHSTKFSLTAILLTCLWVLLCLKY